MQDEPIPGLYVSPDGRTRVLVEGVFNDLNATYQVDFLYADEAENMRAPKYCYAEGEWQRFVREKHLARAAWAAQPVTDRC